MQNPYSHSAAPVTSENQLRADYETAVGQNAGYYVPRFEEFDRGGSKLGWNWPAFFVTTAWFCYRKMWGWGIGNLAWVCGLLLVVMPIAMVIAATGAAEGAREEAIGKVAIVIGLLLFIPGFVLPMFANAFYWRRINRVIRDVPVSFKDQPDKRASRMARNGGTGVGAMIGVLVGGGFLLVMVVGMLAAIAIPAYQDYTLRAQVSEGLNLAATPKAAVAEYYAQNEAWPENGESAGYAPPPNIGKYVDFVAIENGSVVIVYGGAANANLAGKTLVLSPGVDEQGGITWICADRDPPPAVSRGPGPHGTDIPNKYLPAMCRPT